MARAATTADAFNAVAEPRRRQILDVLAGGERPVNALVVELGLAQPQVSKHLRVLREVGAVDVREEGRQRLYRLNGNALKPIHDWVQSYERLWSDRFDELDVVLQETREREEDEMTMPSSQTATVTLPTDEQILITREFDAPRDLVYRAWTTPELVKRWWNAKRGEVTICEIDLRVGGAWRYVMVTEGGARGRLPRRVPRDRPERADRLDRGLRGHPRCRRARDAEHDDVHRGGRAYDAHGPRGGARARRPRRDHRLRDGGGHAGRHGPPGGGRDLASLSATGPAHHGDWPRTGPVPATVASLPVRSLGQTPRALVRYSLGGSFFQKTVVSHGRPSG